MGMVRPASQIFRDLKKVHCPMRLARIPPVMMNIIDLRSTVKSRSHLRNIVKVITMIRDRERHRATTPLTGSTLVKPILSSMEADPQRIAVTMAKRKSIGIKKA